MPMGFDDYEEARKKRQRRGQLLKRTGGILDTAEEEGRELTAEEEQRFDKAMNELQGLTRELGGTYQTRAEAVAAAEKVLSRSEGPIVGLQDGNEPVPADLFDSDNLTRTRALQPGESVRSVVQGWGRHDPELEQLRFGAVMRAMATGARSELERRALSFGIDTAGGYNAPSILSAQVIDLMRPRLVVGRAGARLVPLEGAEHTFAKVDTDPTPGWRTENAAVSEQEVVFGSVTARPRVLAMVVRVSRELLEVGQNIEQLLEGTLARVMAVHVDKAALVGAGTGGEPLGVAEHDVQEIEHDASANYDMLVEARTKLMEKNSAEPTAAILSARDEGTLALLKDGEGLPLPRPPVIERLPILATTNVPVNLGDGSDESLALVGDFTALLLPTRVQMRIQILQERYADNLQVGFLVWLMMDTVVEQTDAFVKVSGLTVPAE